MLSITKTITKDSSRTLIIRNGTGFGGTVHWESDRDSVYAVLVLEECSDDDLRGIVPRIVHEIIRNDRPHRIYVGDADQRLKQVLTRNGFEENGELMYLTIEPWRYDVEDRVFDGQGYIINQGRMDRLPYGAFNTRDRGCGWISAYNLLKHLGRPMPMQTIAHELESRSFSRNIMGTNFLVLYRWLKEQGIPAETVLFRRAEIIRKMKTSDCGILMYLHKHGGHYTCYRNNHDGTLHFWNAVYGARNMELTPEAFFEKYVFFPSAWLIYVNNADDSVVS